MQLYALKLRKSDLALITLLNGGVTPKIEKRNNYFLFDDAWNSDFIPQILTEREFLSNYEFKQNSPLLLSIKK